MQPQRIYPQTIERDKDYPAEPLGQETGSNPNTCQKEDITQQQNTTNNAGLKRKHNLDRKQAFTRDNEKASGAKVNNNQAKKRQEPTNTTQKGPNKI